MEVKQILQKIGLTENESSIYIALLKLGESNPAKLAQHTSIYRPYVYDNLKRLQEKGLVSSIKKEGKALFKAVNPDKLLEMEKESLEKIEKIIPELKDYIKSEKQSTNAELLMGNKVISIIQKDIIKTLLEEKGESLVIGVDEKKFMESDEIAMHHFFQEMQKHKLKERVLIREGDNYLPAKRKTTTYKFLSKDFFEPTSTFIYGNKIAIITFSQPLYGIIIENSLLAQAYRKQFEALWKIAKSK